MSTPGSCKDSASESNDDDVCEMNNMLQNMSTADKDMAVCAACGKEGSNVTNICNKCKIVKYCNAACKKKHRHKHKKACEEYVRLAAEQAAKLHDEKLFKQPPPKEDCPICFIRLPTLGMGSRYKTCCGKLICSGCCYAPVYDNQGNKVDNEKCPFCRTSSPTTDEEVFDSLKKRIEAGDLHAMHNLGNCYRDGTCGCYYSDGMYGLQQDHTKALELWHRAAKLGFARACSSIGALYYQGIGVDVDKKKANHYFELAAIGGDVQARHNLGIVEMNAGNMNRALKHFMIAVRDGYAKSMERIKWLYSNGHAAKDDYTKALQSYQSYLGEIKSKHRDEAAAADDQYRHY